LSQAVDTSVLVAAVIADHDAHELSSDALSHTATTIAQVATEAYSVLTRLPPPLRLQGSQAAAILQARLPGKWLTLNARAHGAALATLAAAGISSGATYDGLTALSALEHEIELLSRDHRAARTYRALGIRFRLLGAGS
jgi:predicted nucleic acid-binding protein